MQTEVKLRERGRATVLARRADVRVREIPALLGSSFGQVYGYLGGLGIRPSEPPFVIYHGMPGPFGLPFEIEVCAPIPGPVDPPEGWRLLDLPAGILASIVHIGPYETLGAAYDELEAWIAEHGYAVHGAPREVYLSEPDTPPAEIRTVVELPVTKTRVAEPAGA
ncbi:MAG TPA: GyrI-like domain-containing protein [Candidatus Limnocylindrales bacterium]